MDGVDEDAAMDGGGKGVVDGGGGNPPAMDLLFAGPPCQPVA